jgi:hypothetical protein
MSENMIQHFEQLYESMDTENLIDLQRKGTLRPEAEEILNAVLEARGVTVVQRQSVVADRGQRIGDRAAGTQVVKVEYLNRPDF